MKLSQLYTNFNQMLPSEQEAFFFSYCDKRKKDIEKGMIEYHGRKKKIAADFVLPPDIKALAKKLGIRQKDLLSLMKENSNP